MVITAEVHALYHFSAFACPGVHFLRTPDDVNKCGCHCFHLSTGNLQFHHPVVVSKMLVHEHISRSFYDGLKGRLRPGSKEFDNFQGAQQLLYDTKAFVSYTSLSCQ